MATKVSETKTHFYNVSVAMDVGVNAAVIFQNICFWVEENTANERNFVNGKYWTYNTVKAFKSMFPEMTENQISYSLRKLKEKGYIDSAYLSEDTRDRTKWYTVCDTDKWISIKNFPKCNLENSNMGTENSEMYNIYNNIDCITDINNADDKLPDKNALAKAKGFNAFSKEKELNAFSPMENKSTDKSSGLEKQNFNNFGNHIHLVFQRYDNRDSELVDDFTSIVVYFYWKYFQEYGKTHANLSDATLVRMYDKYLDYLPMVLTESDIHEYEDFKIMIDKYFETEYNKQGNYDGEVKKCFTHFMSDAILENLYYRTLY